MGQQAFALGIEGLRQHGMHVLRRFCRGHTVRRVHRHRRDFRRRRSRAPLLQRQASGFLNGARQGACHPAGKQLRQPGLGSECADGIGRVACTLQLHAHQLGGLCPVNALDHHAKRWIEAVQVGLLEMVADLVLPRLFVAGDHSELVDALGLQAPQRGPERMGQLRVLAVGFGLIKRKYHRAEKRTERTQVLDALKSRLIERGQCSLAAG